MNKIFLVQNNTNNLNLYNAGSKPRNDILNILKLNNDITIINLYSGNNKIEKLFSLFSNIKEKKLSNSSLLLIEYPFYMNYTATLFYINYLKKKYKLKSACIIHDISSLRYNFDVSKEVKLFNKFDYLVSHNSVMTEWLRNNLVKNKIIDLQVFDYLIKNEEYNKNKELNNFNNKNIKIVFAGNLSKEKSGFLYNLKSLKFENIKFVLYGASLEENFYQNNIIYKGKKDPDELPSIINEDFALIWDGPNIETCSGNFGNYMRYNNPHKLSLYLAAGIPVIVWSKSAISHFVDKYNIGIKIESLTELNNLTSITEKEYEIMKKNVYKIRQNVIGGYYINTALKKIENDILIKKESSV